MKIASWNINGLRSCIQKGLLDFIKAAEFDFIHLQEAKIDDMTYEASDFTNCVRANYPNVYSHLATRRKGYSGVITLAKRKPLRIIYGVGEEAFDNEGRVLTLEYPNYYIVNVYAPHTSRDLRRLSHKLAFTKKLLEHLNALDKSIVLSGDLNVAHTELDIARAKQNIGNAGFTYEERESFEDVLQSGFVDTYRHMHPDTKKYSWWYQAFSARERNIGWRIDYILVSNALQDTVREAEILNAIHGSDHCPVSCTLALS